MNKKTKTRFQLLLAGSLLISFAVAGCNNGSEKTETKTTDSVTTEKSMEVTKMPEDTITKKVVETARTRPTGTPN